MKSRIIYMPDFFDAIDGQLAYLFEQNVSFERIELWFTKLFSIIDELESFPRRHPLSQEESESLGCDVHKMVFGNHLVFYYVNEDKQAVEVLGFRHGAQLGESPTDQEDEHGGD